MPIFLSGCNSDTSSSASEGSTSSSQGGEIKAVVVVQTQVIVNPPSSPPATPPSPPPPPPPPPHPPDAGPIDIRVSPEELLKLALEQKLDELRQVKVTGAKIGLKITSSQNISTFIIHNDTQDIVLSENMQVSSELTSIFKGGAYEKWVGFLTGPLDFKDTAPGVPAIPISCTVSIADQTAILPAAIPQFIPIVMVRGNQDFHNPRYVLGVMAFCVNSNANRWEVLVQRR